MRLLDLFCGAGGAGVGYHRAGFEVVGVDIEPQPDYPFPMIIGDALEPAVDLDAFDWIHASPPCQRFSEATTASGDPSSHPDLIASVRRLLAGRRSVIENVPNAPLRRDVELCGSMFGLEVRRHRVFEISEPILIMAPPHRHEWAEGFPWDVTGNARGANGRSGHFSAKAQAHVKYRDRDHAAELLGMEWVSQAAGIVEAVPPAYTEHIGASLASVGISH